MFKKQMNIIFNQSTIFFAAIRYFALKHIYRKHSRKNIVIFAIVRDVFATKNNYLFTQRFVALTPIKNNIFESVFISLKNNNKIKIKTWTRLELSTFQTLSKRFTTVPLEADIQCLLLKHHIQKQLQRCIYKSVHRVTAPWSEAELRIYSLFKRSATFCFDNCTSTLFVWLMIFNRLAY